MGFQQRVASFEQFGQVILSDLPHHVVVYRVIAVDQIVAEGDNSGEAVDFVCHLRVSPIKPFERFADDNEVPLYYGAQVNACVVVPGRLSMSTRGGDLTRCNDVGDQLLDIMLHK